MQEWKFEFSMNNLDILVISFNIFKLAKYATEVRFQQEMSSTGGRDGAKPYISIKK